MAVTNCTTQVATPTQTPSVSNCSTSDPSMITGCSSATPSILTSSGPTSATPQQASPIRDTYQEFIQQYKQNTGFAQGGLVRNYACGGVTLSPTFKSTCTSLATPQCTTNPALGNTQGGSSTQSTPQPQTYTNPKSGASYKYTCGQWTDMGGSPVQGACLSSLGTQFSCAFASSGVPGVNPGQNASIQLKTEQNATNPTLTCNETDKATLIKNSACQMICPNAYTVNTPQVNVATGGCAQTAACPTRINPNTYNAAQTCVNNPAFSIKAAHGAVDPCAVTSNQIQKLTCFKDGTPGWAQPAINTVNSVMAARGLGSSSIMGGAYVNAIESAATPIAQANAAYFQSLDLANLSNEQQAAVTSAQLTSQALLSNTAAQNAAMQFNATSANQTEQFMANLSTQIQLTNAAQINAMKQFNAGQINSVDEFNANMQNNVDQFNAQNRLAIDQSNVTWRRNINTLNTASINAAAQVNAQNLFNLSATAQNDLWQQMQDEASWANTDSQNALTRAQNMAIAGLGVSTATTLQNNAQKAALLQSLGSFGLNMVGSAVQSFFKPPTTPSNTTCNTACNCVPPEKPTCCIPSCMQQCGQM